MTNKKKKKLKMEKSEKGNLKNDISEKGQFWKGKF